MTIQELKELADYLPTLDAEIAEQERVLKGLNDKRKSLVEQTLVDAFHTAGVSELTLSDGTKMKLKSFYVGRFDDRTKYDAFDWLRNNNHDGIIKNEIKAVFARGEDALAEDTKMALQRLNVLHEHKTTVHPGTLNAFVNEHAEEPGFPKALFNATLIQMVDTGRKK